MPRLHQLGGPVGRSINLHKTDIKSLSSRDAARRAEVVRGVACIPQISASNITTMNLGVPEYGFRGNSKPDRRIVRGHLDVVLQP
jgi:hypothetical protein